MKIPYGISNFKDLITGGYVYIDKTPYIAQLEESGKYQILLRPRRFGKSLFLSTLEHYYDKAYAADFDTLFTGLFIGKNSTALKNSYQVLFMEFSGIQTNSPDKLYSGFNTSVEVALSGFLRRYGYDLAWLQQIQAKSAPEEKMKLFFDLLADQKILLLIDEYDHFANSLLSQDFKLYQNNVGKGGFVRSFYETLKTATQRGIIDRLFITGVTPLMLDSMTSGFNIVENLSLQKDFNATIGFTPTEVASLLPPLLTDCALDQQTVMADLARWYNGYRFHVKAPDSVYNSDMVLYFLKNFDRNNCAYPEQMLDENIASDYGKIMGLFSIGDRDANFAVLDEIINNGTVIATQRRKFDFDKGFDRDDFISLLSYMGFVTLQDKTFTGEVFGIPNQVMRELYFQYFKVELERRNQISIPDRALLIAVEALALSDDIQPLAMEVQRVLQVLSNRDYSNWDEKHVKTLVLTLLYQSPVYFIQSEREMNHKYPDIMLLERSPYEVKHQHLIELKYAKRGEGEKAWIAKRQEGIAQVEGYLKLPSIAALPKLSAWVLVADGERVETVKLQ